MCTACPPGTIHDIGDDSSGPGTPCSYTHCEAAQYGENNTVFRGRPGKKNDNQDDSSG